MKTSQAKAQSVQEPSKEKRQEAFDKKVKPLFGKLAEISALSSDRVQLLDGKRVVWESPAVVKALPRASKKKPARTTKTSSAKKKGPAGAGRPEKTTVRTSVDELQAMREAKAQKVKALLQNKKKTVTQKKAAAASGKSQQNAFAVSRQPRVVKKQKRA